MEGSALPVELLNRNVGHTTALLYLPSRSVRRDPEYWQMMNDRRYT